MSLSDECLPITHDGRVFMNGGNMFSGSVRTVAICHPLILPDEYYGPDSVQYSYEGKTGTLSGNTYRLGPKIMFVSSDPTVEEWRRMFRVIYADGGMFVHGLTYRKFLERSKPKTENECAALETEISHWATGEMPQTQEEMKQFLDEGAIVSVSPQIAQMELSL